MVRCAFTLIETLVAIAIMMILLSLTISAVGSAREAARRISCANSVRQLALAMDQHHLTFQRVPPGTSANARTKYQGWQAKLLPYLDRGNLSGEIEDSLHFSPNLFDTSIHPHMSTVVNSFTCPSDTLSHEPRTSLRFQTRVAVSSYQVCSGVDQFSKDGAFLFGEGRKHADFTDGLSNTLFIGERPTTWRSDLGWWYAGTGIDFEGTLEHRLGIHESLYPQVEYLNCPAKFATFQQGDGKTECHLYHFWSYHRGGSWFSMGDSSVRFIGYETDQIVLLSLATVAGGEVAVAN